jgi:hypothetical protein
MAGVLKKVGNRLQSEATNLRNSREETKQNSIFD